MNAKLEKVLTIIVAAGTLATEIIKVMSNKN